ncbi:MAG TPA: hypothetical protein DEF45_16535 [Rhodopirellula sp.]|nr:MAG: hypothetical protein CBD74_05560 [Saprospirales bacterium TMED214]HBV64618.1 hypothetical protein [Rhodopirellula sp.]
MQPLHSNHNILPDRPHSQNENYETKQPSSERIAQPIKFNRAACESPTKRKMPLENQVTQHLSAGKTDSFSDLQHANSQAFCE